jgi:hypothetical protein
MNVFEAVFSVFYYSKPDYKEESSAWCGICSKDVNDINLITVTYTDQMGDKKTVDMCSRCYKKVQKRVANAKRSVVLN